MDARLHRIEALPGDGRYAVLFRRRDGSEQGAVTELAGGEFAVAEASLPPGWTRGTDAFDQLEAAVRALDSACRAGAPEATLRDVDGGWDVGLGNVVLGADGVPACTADGAMSEQGGEWVCEACGARALLGVPVA